MPGSLPTLSPSTSTIQAYTEALIAHLQDPVRRPNLIGVTITDGPPSVDQNQLGLWIMFGDVDGQQEWATINSTTRPKNEIYVLQCWVDVVVETDIDQSLVNRAAFSLFAEVEDELRDDPEQGVDHVIASTITSPLRVTKNNTDMWRECWIVAGIQVKARI